MRLRFRYMVEHIKNSYGKIYSDFAKKLGIISKQYALLKIENRDIQGTCLENENKYETTLNICILQNLLTQFNEVKKWKEGRGGNNFKVECIWENKLPFGGIKKEDVNLSNNNDPEVGIVLDKLRHILSHPFPNSSGLEYTSESEGGNISSYSFIETDTTREKVFSVTLTPEQIRDLLLKLSEYLGTIASDEE